VQQSGSQSNRPNTKFGKDAGYLERMGDVRLARLAHLRTVGKFSHYKGTVNNREIGLRVIQFGESQNLVQFRRVRPRSRE
jgi:hypothetical protein